MITLIARNEEYEQNRTDLSEGINMRLPKYVTQILQHDTDTIGGVLYLNDLAFKVPVTRIKICTWEIPKIETINPTALQTSNLISPYILRDLAHSWNCGDIFHLPTWGVENPFEECSIDQMSNKWEFKTQTPVRRIPKRYIAFSLPTLTASLHDERKQKHQFPSTKNAFPLKVRLDSEEYMETMEDMLMKDSRKNSTALSFSLELDCKNNIEMLLEQRKCKDKSFLPQCREQLPKPPSCLSYNRTFDWRLQTTSADQKDSMPSQELHLLSDLTLDDMTICAHKVPVGIDLVRHSDVGFQSSVTFKSIKLRESRFAVKDLPCNLQEHLSEEFRYLPKGNVQTNCDVSPFPSYLELAFPVGGNQKLRAIGSPPHRPAVKKLKASLIFQFSLQTAPTVAKASMNPSLDDFLQLCLVPAVVAGLQEKQVRGFITIASTEASLPQPYKLSALTCCEKNESTNANSPQSYDVNTISHIELVPDSHAQGFKRFPAEQSDRGHIHSPLSHSDIDITSGPYIVPGVGGPVSTFVLPLHRAHAAEPSEESARQLVAPVAPQENNLDDMMSVYLKLHSLPTYAAEPAANPKGDSAHLQLSAEVPIQQRSPHGDASTVGSVGMFSATESRSNVAADMTAEQEFPTRNLELNGLNVLVSAELIESQTSLVATLSQQFGIVCTDAPLEEPVSIIIDADTCVCLLPLQTVQELRDELKQFVKALTKIAFKFKRIWLVVYDEQDATSRWGRSGDVEPMVSLCKAISRFPIPIILRQADCLLNVSDIVFSICSDSFTRVQVETQCLVETYLDRGHLSIISDTLHMAQSEFLQLFPILNYFQATQLLARFNLQEMASLSADKMSQLLQVTPPFDRAVLESFCRMMHAHIGLELPSSPSFIVDTTSDVAWQSMRDCDDRDVQFQGYSSMDEVEYINGLDWHDRN